MKKIKIFLTLMLLSVAAAAFAQDITLKGVVSDASNGETLPGASVVLKGTTTGVVTNIDGEYTITVPSDGVVVVSCIGYKTQEIEVNGHAALNVALEVDAELLDETIVVAFGTSTKSAFTGSATVVDDQQIAKSQVSSVTNALAGQVAGVQLTSSNGAPGATSTIRIRGFSSINAGKNPLIILDGAPYEGDMANINQNDVASMTVLKDAASSALYGARGANGVIIITTKKSKSGDANITFDAKVGVNSRALQNYEVISNPAQYYETHYGALYNYYARNGKTSEEAWRLANQYLCGDGGDGGLGYNVYSYPTGQTLIGQNGKLNPNATLGRVVGDYYITPDDWSKLGTRNGLRQEYNFSASGSTEKSSFYASLGYLNEQGITKASDLERFTGRLRADYQVKDWAKIGANVTYTRFNLNALANNGSSTSTGNIWAFTSQMAPIYPFYIRNADGSFKYDGNGIQMLDYGNADETSGGVPGCARPFISDANPIQDSYLNTNNNEGNASTGNVFADITFLPGLVLTVNGTYLLAESRNTYVYNPYYGQFNTTGGTVDKQHERTFNYNLQQLLNYKHTFAALHNLEATLGHEYTNNRYYILYASKSNMFSQTNKELNGAVLDGKNSGSYKTEYNNEGYFARLQYDYDNKIFLSGSFRMDASSNFGKNYRWGKFWSAGAAWIISKEPWFNASWIDELKIKASIGSTGNDNIGSYRYVDTFSISNSSGNVGTSFKEKGTDDITWETNTNINAGVEFSFLDRISGSVEYYRRNTTDMLFSFSVSPSLGYANYYDNVGNLYNQGVELDLHFKIIKNKNFKWNLNFNATTLQNRITMLHPDKKTSTVYDAQGKEHKGYSTGSFFIAEDLPLYTWRYKEYAGVDPETGESLWYKDELDKDGKRTGKRITTKEWSDGDYYVNNKTSIPDLYGGFGTSLEFYGFDFSINCSYQIGGYQYDGTYSTFMASPTDSNCGSNIHVDVLKSWSETNKSSNIPRYQFMDIYSAGASDRFLTKSNYLNIENINFGYTFPSKWMEKIKVQSLRIYFAANNVYYWSMRKGFDPRQSYSDTTNASYYSPMRTLSGGLTIKF